MHWRPSLAELTAPMARPRSWDISLEPFGKGIDNARVDCLLSPRFRQRATDIVRKLIREELTALSRRVPDQLVSTQDLALFRGTYLGLFDATLDRLSGKELREALLLLQLALLKALLQLCAREVQSLRGGLKADIRTDGGSPEETSAQGQLALIAGSAHGIQRQVMHLLFRQIRALESGHLQNLRSSVIGKHWPVPEAVLFNPILLIPDAAEDRALTADYPIAWIGESGVDHWLERAESCLMQVFGDYLPTGISKRAPLQGASRLGRRDQGTLRGFLATEILLDRFVPGDEYRRGSATWLDHPANLHLILGAVQEDRDCVRPGVSRGQASVWQQPQWPVFQRELRESLRVDLESSGLLQAAEAAYMMPALRAQLGYQLPLSMVLDHLGGRLSRRRLNQRVIALRANLDPLAVQRALERQSDLRRRRGQEGVYALVERFLGDFLSLRRDLKLAYKTFEILDGVRVLEDMEDVRLSRSNGSLHEFPLAGETGPRVRRVRAHAVVKADVRGSTLITEELRARGLNPASHFSLNFFNPVNHLLPAFDAEKLFVEGDAVILALYEYIDQAAGASVTRACRLAREILRVVTLQNIQNRENDLPELELGLGISFSPREPNFLYDEGRRIMISSAINQADRLSSCSGLLRRSGFIPGHTGFRVAVVRDAVGGERSGPGRDLLTYNVNGVKLDEGAFLKLQEELLMSQVRLPDGEAEESLFFISHSEDLDGCVHWLVLRYAPVLDWYGDAVGPVEPERRHYFELVADDALASRIRRLLN